MSIITGKKVGSSIISAAYSGNQDDKLLYVTPDDLYQIDDIGDRVYDGNNQTPNPVVRAMFGDVLSEPLVVNVDYTVSYSNNVNVGIATLTVEGIGNYTGRLTKEWNIIPANISVDVSDLGLISTYNGLNQAKPISDKNISLKGNQNYKVKYGTEPEVYTLDNCPEVINVSDSKTIFFQITADNHNPIIGTYLVEIRPKEAELSWGETSWVYDGEEHSTTCIVSNLIGDDTCDVVLLHNSITNIGQVDVQASSLNNENYMISGSVWETIKVLPGLFIKSSNTWTPVKKVYKKVSGSWVRIEYQAMNSTFGGNGTLYTKSQI